MNTPEWHSLLHAGIQAVQQQNAGQALQNLDQAYRLAPTDRLVRYWLANACRLSGDPERAEHLFDSLLDENEKDEEASFAKAFLLREQARTTDAAADLLALSRALPDQLSTQLKIVGFLRDINCFDEAITVCLRAVVLSPGRADILFKLARLYQATGDFEHALSSLRQALSIDPGLGGAWLSLAQLQRVKSTTDRDFLEMEKAAHGQLQREAEMCIAFALGKANDDLGRWSEAWRHFERGNQIRAADQPWNQGQWNRFLADSLGSGTKPGVEHSKRRPLFIVGMLRAGTTLLEQRLDRHPDITGRGEQNFLAHIAERFPSIEQAQPEQRTALADELWSHMRLEGSEGAIYIDKNPLNFRFLGVLFAIMPEARVIHVHRDGRDSCLSCYFQLFQHADAGFCNELDDLLNYYHGYKRLMTHWRSQFSERIHEVAYSDLVESTQTTLAGVLEFIGAAWDDAVMQTGTQERAVRTASTWQARQPIYGHSLSRWKNYNEQAPGFFDAIARIDKARL